MIWDAIGIWDALALALPAIIILLLLAYRRQQQASHARMSRMMVSLHGAVLRENVREALAAERSWQHASFGD